MTAVHNIEIASFFRWYLTVEFQDPAYAKRFHCTHEILEDHMKKVRIFILAVPRLCILPCHIFGEIFLVLS